MLSESITETHDLNNDRTGSTKQQFIYDQFNNAVKACVEYGDGSRTVTYNEYDNSPDLVAPSILLLGRLVRTNVQHFRTAAATYCHDFSSALPEEVITNTATFTYDIRRDPSGKFDAASTGVLKSETANAGHPLAVRSPISMTSLATLSARRPPLPTTCLDRSRPSMTL